MSSSNSAANRELLKANARQLREKEVLQSQEQEPHRQPIFGAPIKKSSHDASYINKVLGRYDEVQPALQKNGAAFVGCATPVTLHPEGGSLFPSRGREKQNGEHKPRSHSRDRPVLPNNTSSHAKSNDFRQSGGSHTYLSSDKHSGRTAEHGKKGPAHLAREGHFQSNYQHNKERSRSKSSSRSHGHDGVPSKPEHHQRSSSAASASVTLPYPNKDGSGKPHTNRISPVKPSVVSTTAKADSTNTSAAAKADSTTAGSSSSSSTVSQKSIPNSITTASAESQKQFKSPLQSPEKTKLPQQSSSAPSQPAPSSGHSKSTAKHINGIIHNGAIKSDPEIKSKSIKPSIAKLWMPKHEITENAKFSEQLHVKNILEEMNLHPPLTGIHTPKKDDSSRFPFPVPSKVPLSKSHLQSESERGNGSRAATEGVTSGTPEGQSGTKPASKSMGGSQGSSQTLEKELELSSDSEDDEQDASIPKKQNPKKPPRKRSRSSLISASMSSSSGSESSDSDSSSGSDSSSSEEGEEEEEAEEQEAASVEKEMPIAASSPLPTTTQGKEFSWALLNFKQDNKSMEGPGNLITAEDTSYHNKMPDAEDISINTSSLIDKSNAEALDALSDGLDKLVNSVPSLLSPVDSKSMDFSVPINMDLDIKKEVECDTSKEKDDLFSELNNSSKVNADTVSLDGNAKALKLKIPNWKLNGEQSKSNNGGDVSKSANIKSPSASSVKSSNSVKSSSISSQAKHQSKSSKKNSSSSSSEKAKVSHSKTEEKVKSTSKRSKSEGSSKKTPTKSDKTGSTTPKGPSTPKNSSISKAVKKGKGSPKPFKAFTSKEFISTSESSSDDESCIVDVEAISPPKMNGDVSKKTVSPSIVGKSPKSDKKSATSIQKSEKKSATKLTPEKSKLKDKTNLTNTNTGTSHQSGKALDDSLVNALDVVTNTFPMPEPLLSPIPNVEASSMKNLPGLTFVNGKPSLMVHIDLSKLDRIPVKKEVKKEKDVKKEPESDFVSKTVPVVEPPPPLHQSDVKTELVKSEVKTSPAEAVKADKQTCSSANKSYTSEHHNAPVPKTEPESDASIIVKTEGTVKTESNVTVENAVVRTVAVESPVTGMSTATTPSALDVVSSIVNNPLKSSLPRIPKRKSAASEGKTESKRIRTEGSRKSTPKRKSEVLSDQKEPVSHEDDHEWDRKHPRRSSERRNSTSSNSSRHSSTRSERELNHDSGSRDRWDNNNRDKYDNENKNVLDTDHDVATAAKHGREHDAAYRSRKERELSRDKDLPDSRDSCKSSRDRERDRERDQERSKDRERERVKESRDREHLRDWDRDLERERNRTRERDREGRMRSWDAPNGLNAGVEPQVGHRAAAMQWSSLMSSKGSTGQDWPAYPHDQLPPQELPRKVELFPEEKGLKDWNHYHTEAKNLKHQASNVSDSLSKAIKYMEAVLSFLLCGNSMEREMPHEQQRIFNIYKDTNGFAKYITKYFSTSDSLQSDGMKKLYALLLKIQAVVTLKLYHLKKVDVFKLKKVIDDHNNKPSTGKPSAQAPSPYQGGWNKGSTGTPSPMSPQPSPVGSTSSLGSQGSSAEMSTSRLTNGTASSGSNVTIPARIHSVIHNYISHTHFLVQSDDLWEQSDMQVKKYKAFFDALDCQCGETLSIRCSILSLVRYVRCGLHKLKDT